MTDFTRRNKKINTVLKKPEQMKFRQDTSTLMGKFTTNPGTLAKASYK